MNDFQYFLEKVYNFIAIRMRSKYEVEAYLNKKIKNDNQQKQEIISEIIKKLEDKGYVDDEEFSELFVSSRIAKHKGKNLIEKELLQKGVDKGTILTVLSRIDQEEVLKQCKYLAEKKMRSIKAKTSFEKTIKLKRYLFQKGYNSNEINISIESLTQSH